MLLENDQHKKWHSLSPKDIHWGKKSIGGKKDAVMTIHVSRSTIDNEQIQCTVPVFESDTRETLMDRLGLVFSVTQDRMEEANKAWQIVAEKQEAKALANVEKVDSKKGK